MVCTEHCPHEIQNRFPGQAVYRCLYLASPGTWSLARARTNFSISARSACSVAGDYNPPAADPYIRNSQLHQQSGIRENQANRSAPTADGPTRRRQTPRFRSRYELELLQHWLYLAGDDYRKALGRILR